MKILFMVRHFGCLRSYEEAILAFAARGHQVHLVAHVPEAFGGEAMVERLAAANPAITLERLPETIADGPWDTMMPRVRLMLDYLRYLEPAYRAAPRLEERARRRTPQGVLRVLDRPGGRSRPMRRLLSWMLRAVERAAPRPPEVDAFLRAQAPDVVLFTPLIGLGSEEIRYLEGTRPLGLRAVFCVWSWDNLSSKALLRTMPDLVTVWNDTQRQEAIDLHGAPADRVCVTGAQAFDRWFGRQPSRSREAFCARVGLPSTRGDEGARSGHRPSTSGDVSARPFLLWVCSGLIKGSPPEAPFVRRWIEAIRASHDEVLQQVPILVRPHPSRMPEWQDVSLDGLGPVAFWGANPIDEEAKADYFDSMYYSAAVAGLNTSAFIEAAIVGKPVYTVLLPEFYENQEGTLHFQYLLTLDGGMLHAARTLEAHLADLATALRAPAAASDRSRRFVERFVRPFGPEVAGTDRFVEAIEALAARPAPRPVRDPFWASWVRRWLAPLAERGPRGELPEWMLSPQEAAKQERLRQSRRAKDEGRQRIHDERIKAKQQRLQEYRERKARERAERRGMSDAQRTP